MPSLSLHSPVPLNQHSRNENGLNRRHDPQHIVQQIGIAISVSLEKVANVTGLPRLGTPELKGANEDPNMPHWMVFANSVVILPSDLLV